MEEKIDRYLVRPANVTVKKQEGGTDVCQSIFRDKRLFVSFNRDGAGPRFRKRRVSWDGWRKEKNGIAGGPFRPSTA